MVSWVPHQEVLPQHKLLGTREKASPKEVLQFWGGKAAPKEVLTDLLQQRRFPQYKSYSSEGKGSLAIGSQGILRSHTAQQSHARDLLGGKNPGGWLPLLRGEAGEN